MVDIKKKKKKKTPGDGGGVKSATKLVQSLV